MDQEEESVVAETAEITEAPGSGGGHKKKSDKPEKQHFSEDLRILEALLFASDELLSPARLKAILPGEPDARVIRRMVNDINAALQAQRHPFEIIELGGGYQFRTIPYYQPWVRQLLKEKSVKKLSVQALECLAIISYKQPITKAEIESVRGVLSDGAMKTLLERRLVTMAGRKEEAAGRPLLYKTTPEFLEYFGINRVEDLPQIEEFEAMAREKMEDLTDAELKLTKETPEESSGEETGQGVPIVSEDASETIGKEPSALHAESSEHTASDETVTLEISNAITDDFVAERDESSSEKPQFLFDETGTVDSIETISESLVEDIIKSEEPPHDENSNAHNPDDEPIGL
jgi:segregation and condensation protein B